MTDKTVKELAVSVGRSVNELLEKIIDAGLPQRRPEDIISTEDQDNLIAYLKEVPSSNKVSFKKRNMNTATLSNSKGATKTINVEVRKKQIFNTYNMDVINKSKKIIEFNYEKLRIILTKTIKEFLIINDCEIQEEDLTKRIEFNEESKIKKLNLSNLNLKSLKQISILDLTETVEIDLSKNYIKKITISSKMSKMLKLNLTGNPIEEIIINSDLPSWNCLVGLETKDVRLLDLSLNKFTEFKMEENFQNLEILILNSNIEDIAEVVISTKLLKIRELKFNYSHIKKFSIIEKLPNSLEVLSISNNNINYLKLPYDVFDKKMMDHM